MPRERIDADTIDEAVSNVIPYLEDTSNTTHKAIYFDGAGGLAASAVLRAIAQDPPPSLLKKFDRIIHVDCSRWKSRRALQRTIAQELKLPQRVMDIFDRQDEEDDFRGVVESSRAEIAVIAREIHNALREHISLVVFHNGSNNMVGLTDSGIPQAPIFDVKVLWTFRGRLRLNQGISEKVDPSHLFLYDEYSTHGWNYLLQLEAREIAGYTDNLGETVEECYLYLLSLNYQGGNIMDYNWATHSSNYWVCDGIIQGGQGDEAWKVAAALHQHIDMEDYSSNALPSFGDELKTPPKRWILAKDSSVVQPGSTSVFLAAVARGPDPPLRTLPNDMFHQSDKLRVLKLCHCTFSFSAPPFCCCHNLRFLGLDGCKDQRAEEEDEKQDRPAMEFFENLWVLDICHTDWELDLATYITEKMAANIREVHIKKGRIWCHSFAWRQLHNLQKLLVIEPTRPWQTGGKDEFTDTVKMEFLNLSGNRTLQVLPNLSKATSLKTLVLDACVGLEHLGPEALPPLLESFSLDVGGVEDHSKEAQISRISMAGCARLSNFKLGGSLPNLEELDLSGTGVKTLDLTTQVVQVPCLQRVMLLGCEQLRAVLWPEKEMSQLCFLCIDTRGGEEVGRIPPDFEKFKKGHCQAYVAMVDIKFIQILTQTTYINTFWNMGTNKFSLNLCISASGQWCNKGKMGSGNCGNILGPALPKSLIPNHCYDVFSMDNITIDHDYNSAAKFQPLARHVEIGEGISNTSMESTQGNKAIIFVMDKAESLHVHDNYSINTIIPECVMTIEDKKLGWSRLQQCRVERCPKLDTVFATNYDIFCFEELQNFWAADLLMASCVWSRGNIVSAKDTRSFVNLQSIHLYSCPRLKSVLPLSWAAPGSYFPNLETLHIVSCGDLDKVFPVEPEFLTTISNDDRKGVLEFPELKHIYLHELYKLQHICEAKMYAPKLETMRVRGCWGLRRIPAVGQDIRPIVDCEKDWWEKLEWDGPEASHDPSLYDPRHSSYYKKPLPRFSVLW
ncbi:hypothetical protein CFC21_014307 [Triticum aestivum]|uniref:NB-ARC domain-containing protein n=2 Tax=Triticum aestivum TaxID=4565 RepID=A0A9R1DTY4_WHEAT|nr:uncharacterized protein LOC123186884 [Triticum aestivum]KAF6998163.1 hypothetical protein CFC21_014306 [Triticum aestivum]KAF6998164.1 hypothetical protein CFC21_014307 [Triticum aestivum]